MCIIIIIFLIHNSGWRFSCCLRVGLLHVFVCWTSQRAMNEFENLYFHFLCVALFICFTYSTIIEWEYVRVISWLSLMNGGLMKLYTVYKK